MLLKLISHNHDYKQKTKNKIYLATLLASVLSSSTKVERVIEKLNCDH